MDDNIIIITDDKGNEKEMTILFTFDNDDKNYVVCYDKDDEETVYPFRYNDKGELFAVEDEDELSMIDEVVQAFDGVEDEENS